MLSEILKAFETGHIYSQHDLCEALHISEDGVRAQIEFLELQGYIKRITLPSCNGKTCAGCNGCGGRNLPPLMWEINKSVDIFTLKINS